MRAEKAPKKIEISYPARERGAAHRGNEGRGSQGGGQLGRALSLHRDGVGEALQGHHRGDPAARGGCERGGEKVDIDALSKASD